MSRRDAKLPWRVIAISALLFAALGYLGWTIFAPAPPPAAAGADPSGGAVAAGSTGATEGTTATAGPSTDPAGTTGALSGEAVFDPTRPETRLALVRERAARGSMEIQLFLIVPGIERLIPVVREVPAPSTLDSQAQRAVEELIGWAGTQTLSPVPAEAGVREVWVSPGGIAYVDFDQAFHDFAGGGTLGELHAVYGVVATLVESFPEIRAVQILIEGQEVETLAGHVDLSRPLLPSDDWVLLESGSSDPSSPNGRGSRPLRAPNASLPTVGGR